jgi:hypothetical protein
MTAKKKVEIDLQKHSTPTVHTDGSLGVQLPSDVPIHLRAFRLLSEFEGERPVMGLVGWTAQLDCFTFDVKIYIRVGRDGTLRVIAEDLNGRQLLMKWGLEEDDDDAG